MVGSKRELPIGATLTLPDRLLLQQGMHDLIHVRTPTEMTGLKKYAVLVNLDTAQMGGMDARSESFHDSGEIVVRSRTQRS